MTKEISALEQSIEMHIIALSKTFDPTERMMYQDNINKYKNRYLELTGKEYVANPKMFNREDKEWENGDDGI